MKTSKAKYNVFTVDNIPHYTVNGKCPKCNHMVYYSEEFEMKPHYNKIEVNCDNCSYQFKLEW